MNKQPVSYLQTDTRWKNVSWKGMTCGVAGCGPTCAAMMIATLVDPSITPADTYKWAGDNGHLSAGQGTIYTMYFQKQLEKYGIKVEMLNWQNSYGNPNHPNHDTVLKKLQEGYYAIALMNKGLWTSSGHFVVVWWEDNTIHINDPASTISARTNADPYVFKSQVKYYWLIDAREFNKEEEDMTQEKFNEMFAAAMKEYRSKLQDNDSSTWSEAARKFCIDHSLFNGDADGNYSWEDFLTREQCAVVMYNLFLEFLLDT